MRVNESTVQLAGLNWLSCQMKSSSNSSTHTHTHTRTHQLITYPECVIANHSVFIAAESLRLRPAGSAAILANTAAWWPNSDRGGYAQLHRHAHAHYTPQRARVKTFVLQFLNWCGPQMLHFPARSRSRPITSKNSHRSIEGMRATFTVGAVNLGSLSSWRASLQNAESILGRLQTCVHFSLKTGNCTL